MRPSSRPYPPVGSTNPATSPRSSDAQATRASSARAVVHRSAQPKPDPAAAQGLDGVVAAHTRLSSVDGEAGRLIIAGYAIEDLAGTVSWEALLHLLWFDALPSKEQLRDMRSEFAARRSIDRVTSAALHAAAVADRRPIDCLRIAIATMNGRGGDPPPASMIAQDKDAEGWNEAIGVLARIPVCVASAARWAKGSDVPETRTDLGHAGNLLWQLHGVDPSAAAIHALDSYLVTTADHGLNASTFTARVIAATGADLPSALTGAVGALSGWRHGGAPGPVLAMLAAIERPERAEEWLRARLAARERLMGFGHRVYRVRDPRADVLRAAVERLRDATPDGPAAERLRLATAVEETALRVLAEHRPERPIRTNVEFYTAVLLDGLGIPPALFTPIFAVARSAGWAAHAREAAAGRLIRPRSAYVGRQPDD